MDKQKKVLMLVQDPPPSLTPAKIKDWRVIKDRYPYAVMVFRLGDEYVALGDYAEYLQQAMDRPLLSCNDLSVCCFSVSSLDRILRHLVDLGNRAAVCDPLEEPGKNLFT